MSSPLIDEKQVAEMLGISPATLRTWRYKGRGPKYIKIGSHVRYDRAVLDEWLTCQIRSSTSEKTVREGQ